MKFNLFNLGMKYFLLLTDFRITVLVDERSMMELICGFELGFNHLRKSEKRGG